MSKISMQDLGMKRLVAKFALRILLPEQKEHCAAGANDAARTVPTLDGD